MCSPDDLSLANPTVQLVLGVSVAAILLALTAVSCPPMWRWGQEKMESRAAGRRAKEQENPTYASGLYYTEEGDRIQVRPLHYSTQEGKITEHNEEYGQVEESHREALRWEALGGGVATDRNSSYE